MARIITTATAFEKHHPNALINRIIASLPSGFATAPVIDAVRSNIYTGKFEGMEFCPGKVSYSNVLLGFVLNLKGNVEILQVWRHGANIWDVLNMAQLEELEQTCKAFKANQKADTECDVTGATENTYERTL